MGKIYQEELSSPWRGDQCGEVVCFNLFLKEDRSIVSDIHGTTRDFLESWISLSGIPVRLYDTAGLRQSKDPIEEEGIRRTKKVIENAHIVLYLLDGSAGISDEDRAVLEEPDPGRVLVWNKADLAAVPVPKEPSL